MENQLSSPLPAVLDRIAIGICAVAFFITLFFSVWALAGHKLSVVIGVVVFQCLGLLASGFLMWTNIITKHEDFVEL